MAEKSMTKSDLIRWVSVKNGIQHPDAEVAVNRFFETIMSALRDGRRVELRGFGSFSVRDYDGYMGRNPRTGEPIPVPPKKLPFFKVGKDMKEAVDNY
jgi:integration host factor subunit beta